MTSSTSNDHLYGCTEAALMLIDGEIRARWVVEEKLDAASTDTVTFGADGTEVICSSCLSLFVLYASTSILPSLLGIAECVAEVGVEGPALKIDVVDDTTCCTTGAREGVL